MTIQAKVFAQEEKKEPIKRPPQSVRPNGHGAANVSKSTANDIEIRRLNEDELKAAIKSSWKKHAQLAKKDMGPLLYWLRETLRAQGSRNDLREKDKGFGAWVEENIDISRRTADRWADEYGLANGLMKRKLTSRQKTKSSEQDDPDDEFYANELREHGRLIQMNHWVNQNDYARYDQALSVIKKHFKVTNNTAAILKGVHYAAQSIAAGL